MNMTENIYPISEAFINWINEDFQTRVLDGEKAHLPPKNEQMRSTTLNVARHALVERYGSEKLSYDGSGASRNSVGYDFIINQGVRIRVTGCRWKELLDFNIGDRANKALEDSDIWMVADFSGYIDGQYGKYASEPGFKASNEMSFWLAPTAEIREIVSGGHFGKNRVRLQYRRTGSDFKKASYAPLAKYRENWDAIEQLRLA